MKGIFIPPKVASFCKEYNFNPLTLNQISFDEFKMLCSQLEEDELKSLYNYIEKEKYKNYIFNLLDKCTFIENNSRYI